ncbi:phenylacetate-CoA oxygenase subunit PaaJ [Granulosicoccus sp.]|nr:1,2-phenylacetyl-CoA epoxidase subunit PaaD [Granulosicoccus sp.]MDB4224392.1 phenylacetate-CoA oxygenase subunit PaaJ [Granulosicoccus sp.]
MKSETIHWQTKKGKSQRSNVISLQERQAATLGPQRTQQLAWDIAASVLDPEVPAVTVAELGILRHVEITDNGHVIAQLTPTYSGCPAVLAIENLVQEALEAAGYSVTIERVLSPAWTTDWITDEGLAKLKAYGIAPPAKVSNHKRSLFSNPSVACPACDSFETTLISEFGSTACKAHYQCKSCNEPFDYFKCL